MFAIALLAVEQELVDRIAAGQRGFQRVGEFGPDPVQGAPDQGGIVRTGFTPPLRGQGARARVEAGGQLQGLLAQQVRQRDFEARRRGRAHAPSGQRAERRAHRHAVVVGQMRTLGRGDRQVERDQLAAVGGLDLKLVVPLPVAVLDACRRQAAQPRGLGPGAAVVVPHDRATPVHLLGWRGRAEELGTQGRILIRHQVQPTAGRHLVAQARLGQGAFGHAPERGGETREQPERRQHQRQADQHQSTHQRHAGHHVRSRGHAARLHVGQPVQRDPAPWSGGPGRAGTPRTARTGRSPAGCGCRAGCGSHRA